MEEHSNLMIVAVLSDQLMDFADDRRHCLLLAALLFQRKRTTTGGVAVFRPLPPLTLPVSRARHLPPGVYRQRPEAVFALEVDT